jgi:putative tryptophan/tyrosine transport system substrate-binding protein
MKRRDFITLLGGAAASWPLAARAQQGERVRRIGVLTSLAADDPESQARHGAFLQGLQESGWSVGRNVRIDYRFAAGDTERVRKYAAELVALAPDVVVGTSTAVVTAFRQAARSIPIVFIGVMDPVGQGLVPSLAQPGGEMTGFGLEEPSMGGKWLELLKAFAPRVARIAVIFNPETAPYARLFVPSIDAAGHSLTVEPIVSPILTESELEQAIAAVARNQLGGLIVLPDPFTTAHRELIIALAARHRVPAIYALRSFAAGGGLIAYGMDRVDLYRRAASYVDRILKGTKVADLPIQMPTRFELVINLKTAKALGLEVPPTLLARADEVIE